MSEPTDADVPSPYDGYHPRRRWRRKQRDGWAAVSAAAVRENLERTGYPPDRVHLVEGKVEETIRHELAHLYPRLVSGGVLIVDDYGHYEGARRAVDEHFAGAAEPILMSRIDYTGRIGVKR